MKTNNIARLVGTLVLPAVALTSGCGTFNGICQDGKTLFTAVGNQTQKWADAEADAHRNMQENAVNYQNNRSASVLRYYENKDKATANAYNQANASDSN